tara:strand:+ start:754 stop:948 length:195 start_codon:yes stop_codon:yes gene_type:complete
LSFKKEDDAVGVGILVIDSEHVPHIDNNVDAKPTKPIGINSYTKQNQNVQYVLKKVIGIEHVQI